MRDALVAAAALVLLAAASAAAHGEHGSHGGPMPAGATSQVAVEGYRVEVLTDPGPLAVGRESRVIARISTPSGAAVTRASVSIAVANDAGPPAFVGAREVTWAGSYAVPYTPTRTGIHRVRVVVSAVGGRALARPLELDVQVPVERAPGVGRALWMLIALTGGVAATALYLVAVKARLAPAGGLNLLELGWFRRLLTSRAFPLSLQIPLLVLTAIVVVLGVVDVQDGGRNLATKLTWTIWWAGVIFTFVLAGRVWCLACPFGALNEWASRVAGPRRRLPRIFRNIWWATGMFLLLTWADEQLGVVRSPRVTAWILVLFAAVAIAVGLRYERRSFCRHLCPIGGLIGIYSMTAPIELRAKDAATCRGHREKECYRGGAAGQGCPMFEFPQAMDRNNYCTLCAECVKGCGRDNLALRFRALGKDLWASGRRVLDESYLAVALVGLTLIVTAEMLTGWPGWVSGLARWLPAVVRQSFKPVTYLGMVETAILFGGTLVVGPGLVLGAAAVADRLAGRARLGLRRSFVVFGYMFVPIGLGMHLAHNLAHLLLEGEGIVPVVQRTVARWTPLSFGVPDWQITPLADPSVVGVLQLTVVVASFALSLGAGHRLALSAYRDARAATRALVPFAVLAFVFTVAGLIVLTQPMGMRHGM